jgi:molecular chaperone HscC
LLGGRDPLTFTYMGTIVGIDLGTTNSLCAIFANGAPKLIPNAHGDVLTPSVVGILDDGQFVVGAAARELRVTRPQRCASRFKRLMGTLTKLPVAGQSFSPTELSSLVLKLLKHDAEQYLGHAVDEAVITVPAYFNDDQRKATRVAGELAGFKVRRIINEPTAAALTYGFHDRTVERHFLVIDLGGGTFDVTLMEVFNGTLEIIATAGECFLGGEDFTDRLVGAVLKDEGIMLETAELKEPLRVARLRHTCEVAKRELVDSEESSVALPDSLGQVGAKSKTVCISRLAFAQLVAPLVARLKGPIDKVLRDGDRAPADVDEVILVGGATRTAAVRDFVRDYFDKEPLIAFNPDEVVALGAAVQAALIADDRAVDDMVMTDVCPFTLGVEVSKKFAQHHQRGYFHPVIHRNTTIPVSREDVLATITQNQRELLLCIYQGESRRVKENLLLGELRVVDIPPGPAGSLIVVRFTYDLNGILEVEAFVPNSQRRFRTVLTQNAAGLSEDEIAQAIERLSKIKFYPRDRVENQRLALYCERVVGEVPPAQRGQLEEALDLFESSMSSGDRELFAHARAGLLMVLSQLGFGYEAEGTAFHDAD